MEMTADGAWTNPDALRAAWTALRAKGTVRNRDAARQLGVSEAELIASQCGQGVTRLEGDFRRLLERLHELGPVMALTRNDDVVHEKIGRYENVSADGMVGLALGEDIDLRLFFRHWTLGYAVEEATDHGPRSSLQFYDASGTAVHKMFLRDQIHAHAYRALVEAFASDCQTRGERVAPPAPAAAEVDDAAVDQDGLLAGWSQLKDTHEFFPLLKKFNVGRRQALRLARSRFAQPVLLRSVRALLDDVASTQLPIMVFVGNRGCIQIHTGPVVNVKPMGPWLNVMDPGFNLHLREDRIASAWVVRKPTTEGDVTSLELFNAAGETMAMLFGKRKPGVPEMPGWREAVARLPALEVAP
jgi:putative hemin transport protein